jgi:hypothetical protein
VAAGAYIKLGDGLIVTRVPGNGKYRITKLNDAGEFESWVGDFRALEVNYIAGQVIIHDGVYFGELRSLPM